MGETPVLTLLSLLQGRHVKTGQLAAIKVMDVTEVSREASCFISNAGEIQRRGCHVAYSGVVLKGMVLACGCLLAACRA